MFMGFKPKGGEEVSQWVCLSSLNYVDVGNGPTITDYSKIEYSLML